MVAHSKILLGSSAGFAALALVTSASVQAQEARDRTDPIAGAPDMAVDDKAPIIVTGTRIARPENESSNPITYLTADYIARSGETNLTDLLAESPALVGSITSIRTAGPRGEPGQAGINLLDLRNLGTQRTLVLVNGRRHVASIAGSTAVDINTIPVGLVERVDVLTGGVSAIYGADGVSGVVNFVLKRDFEGIELRGQNGISSRGDGQEYFASLTAGQNFSGGAGNVALSYEYRRTGRISADQRKRGHAGGYPQLQQNLADLADDPNVPDKIPYDDLRIANLSPLGAIDVNFDGRPDFNGEGSPYNLGEPLPNSFGLAQGGEGTPVAGFSGDFQPSEETHNLNLLFSYEFSPAVRLFAEGKYVSTEGYTEAQPTFDLGGFLYSDNPYLPDSVRAAVIPGVLGAVLGAPPGAYPRDGVLEFRSQFDFGRRSQRSKRETWRGVIGLDGEIGDHARYEVAYTYGQTKNRFTFTGWRVVDRYFAALDAVSDGAGNIVCRSSIDPSATFLDANYGGPPITFTPGPGGGCVPINILGQNVANQDALAFFQPDLVNRMKLTQHVATGSVTGDFGKFLELPGGPVRFAMGGEYRKETSSLTPDQLLQDGMILDAVQVNAESGSFDVWEGFAELQAPILRDVPGAQLLQVGAAIRLSDYSTVGSTTTWKVDGTYAPVRDLRFRATYSESVRAPNISELFASQSGNSYFISDPCDTMNVPVGTEYRAANCAAILSGLGIDPATFNPSSSVQSGLAIFGQTSGNPDLQEETAKTWTAGFVLTPSFAPGLSASFDWYDIKLTNAINTPTPQEVADLCVDQPTVDNSFCPNISRDPATGFINNFVVTPANVSRFRTSGADFSVSYSYAPAGDWGAFNLRFVGGYLDKLSFVATPGAAETTKAKEMYAPKWTGNLDLTWTKGNVTANYGVAYSSKTRRFTLAEVEANPDISDPKYLFFKSKWEHDVQIAVDTYDHRVTVYGGVKNLFDTKPALGRTDYPVSYRGRFFYFGIKADLDGL